MRARQGGLSQAGQSRLNKAIKAFVYYILGAQVNRRSTIMGDGGRANERRPGQECAAIPTGFGRNKARLNFALKPGGWLLPTRMVINTERVAGCNNKIMQPTPDIKLGINNVNTDKKVGLRLMDGGPSKINKLN